MLNEREVAIGDGDERGSSLRLRVGELGFGEEGLDLRAVVVWHVGVCPFVVCGGASESSHEVVEGGDDA